MSGKEGMEAGSWEGGGSTCQSGHAGVDPEDGCSGTRGVGGAGRVEEGGEGGFKGLTGERGGGAKA